MATKRRTKPPNPIKHPLLTLSLQPTLVTHACHRMKQGVSRRTEAVARGVRKGIVVIDDQTELS
mgnify:CR=1 FL=1|jgi:hypothetical protein